MIKVKVSIWFAPGDICIGLRWKRHRSGTFLYDTHSLYLALYLLPMLPIGIRLVRSKPLKKK